MRTLFSTAKVCLLYLNSDFEIGYRILNVNQEEISLKSDITIIFSGWCRERTSLEEMCMSITSDDTLFSMFRVNSKPISCPFSGASFTFTYNRGYGECAMPISLAEKCTDESKLLLKYQACPDVTGTESNSKLTVVLSALSRLLLCLMYYVVLL